MSLNFAIFATCALSALVATFVGGKFAGLDCLTKKSYERAATRLAGSIACGVLGIGIGMAFGHPIGNYYLPLYGAAIGFFWTPVFEYLAYQIMH
jgi:hypothetical protein